MRPPLRHDPERRRNLRARRRAARPSRSFDRPGVLATLCGLTLLVLRAEKSSRPLTIRARDALSTVHAEVVGAVVNDVSKRDSRYSHYRAYSYHYGGNKPVVLPMRARKQLPSDGTTSRETDESASGGDVTNTRLTDKGGTA